MYRDEQDNTERTILLILSILFAFPSFQSRIPLNFRIIANADPCSGRIFGGIPPLRFIEQFRRLEIHTIKRVKEKHDFPAVGGYLLIDNNAVGDSSVRKQKCPPFGSGQLLFASK